MKPYSKRPLSEFHVPEGAVSMSRIKALCCISPDGELKLEEPPSAVKPAPSPAQQPATHEERPGSSSPSLALFGELFWMQSSKAVLCAIFESYFGETAS